MNWKVATHNGFVTMVNTNTGNHRTVRIRTQPQDSRFAPGKRVVSLLVGPDNENSYRGFAFADEQGNVSVWRRFKGTDFETYARMIERPEQYAARGVEYKFEGRCRVCNRTLTNPESIDAGIGPVCAEQQGR